MQGFQTAAMKHASVINKQLLPHPPFRGVHEWGATIEEM
jgi:hypothetical protein